jgi:hypothetical protein
LAELARPITGLAGPRRLGGPNVRSPHLIGSDQTAGWSLIA